MASIDRMLLLLIIHILSMFKDILGYETFLHYNHDNVFVSNDQY